MLGLNPDSFSSISQPSVENSSLDEGAQCARLPGLAFLQWIITECLLSTTARGAKLQQFCGEKYLNYSPVFSFASSVCGLVFPISLTPIVIADLWREAKCYYQSWGWERCG